MNEQTIEQVTNDFNAKTKEHASEAVKILNSFITEEDEKIWKAQKSERKP